MKLKMTRGDTFAFDVVVSDSTGTMDITGGLLIFTLKKSYSDADINAVTQKRSPSSGITIIDAPTGKARVTIAPADTSSLTNAWQSLYWDVQLVLSGNVYTVASGTMIVSPEVTQSLS